MAMGYGRTSNANEALYGLLDSTLGDILSLIKPAEEDQVSRLNTVKDIRTAVQAVSGLRGTGLFFNKFNTDWCFQRQF